MNLSPINVATINGSGGDATVRAAVGAFAVALVGGSGGRVWTSAPSVFGAKAEITTRGLTSLYQVAITGQAQAVVLVNARSYHAVYSPLNGRAEALALVAGRTYNLHNVRVPLHGLAEVVFSDTFENPPTQYGYNVYGGFKWLFRNL